MTERRVKDAYPSCAQDWLCLQQDGHAEACDANPFHRPEPEPTQWGLFGEVPAGPAKELDGWARGDRPASQPAH